MGWQRLVLGSPPPESNSTPRGEWPCFIARARAAESVMMADTTDPLESFIARISLRFLQSEQRLPPPRRTQAIPFLVWRVAG
jgi:hypothetical protein